MPSIKNSQRTVQLLVSRQRIGPAVPVLPNVIYLRFALRVCGKLQSHTAELSDIGTPVDA